MDRPLAEFRDQVWSRLMIAQFLHLRLHLRQDVARGFITPHGAFADYGVALDAVTAGGDATTPELAWVSRLADAISESQLQPVSMYNNGIGANVISQRSPAHNPSRGPSAMERVGLTQWWGPIIPALLVVLFFNWLGRPRRKKK